MHPADLDLFACAQYDTRIHAENLYPTSVQRQRQMISCSLKFNQSVIFFEWQR